MLHILLLILKIIGIILAAILGIIVLLVCVVLFMPVRYEARAECDGTLDGLTARMRCTWFLGLFRFSAVWQEKELQWGIRLLWIKRPKEESIKRKEEEGNAYEEKPCETVEAVEEKKEQSQKSSETIEKTEEEAEKEPGLSEGIEAEHEKIKTHIAEKSKSSEPEKSKFQKIKEACKSLYYKIKYTMKQICGKIQLLLQKKEKAVDFLTDEVHKKAFVKVKCEAFRLLRSLKPKKLNLYVHYGFEDPYRTGQVLAGVGMLYPFLGKHAQVVPDFENQILEGNIYIRGKLCGIHFVTFAFRLLLNKAIRNTYKDVRSFEL